MSGHTHAILGANAAWLAVLAGVDSSLVLFLAVGAVAGLLPDIDAQAAKIHFIAGGIFGVFRGVFKHRGFIHSLLFTAILFLVAHIALRQYHPILPVVIGVGYLSHLLVDGFNKKGVPYLMPFSKKRLHLVPKILRTPVGGLLDQLLFIGGVTGVAILLLREIDFSVVWLAL